MYQTPHMLASRNLHMHDADFTPQAFEAEAEAKAQQQQQKASDQGKPPPQPSQGEGQEGESGEPSEGGNQQVANTVSSCCCKMCSLGV